MLKSLFDPPVMVEPLTVWGVIWVVIGIAASLAIATMAATLYERASDAAFAGICASAALLMLPCAFAIYRALSPTDAWANRIFGIGLILVLPALFAWSLSRLRLEGAGWAATGLGAASALAMVFDWANERLASIPLSWGFAGIIVVGGALVLSERSK